VDKFEYLQFTNASLKAKHDICISEVSYNFALE